MISLNAIGKDTRQTGDFCIWRPDGSGDNLLVIFKTSAVLIQNGKEITVSPDSLILYSKGTMQHYKTLCGSYVNHFVHFDTDDTELMNGIKTDTLITSEDIPAIEELLTILCRENVAGSTNRKQYENMLMQMILMKISDLCGYGNEICFMKIFKKRTGITPSEYRKISKNDNLKNNFIW